MKKLLRNIAYIERINNSALADKIGLTAGQLSLIVNGHLKISEKQLDKFSKFLGVEPRIIELAALVCENVDQSKEYKAMKESIKNYIVSMGFNEQYLID